MREEAMVMGVSPDGKFDALERAIEALGPGDLLVTRYLRWLQEQGRPSSAEESLPSPEVVVAPVAHGEPFLSVICRTQGKRVEELREALASLSRQSERDMQLIVVGHNLDDEAQGRVMDCLDSLDEWLRSSLLFLKVSGGTRTRPLNVALPHVAGRYFSVLDEDDLAYENYVSAFKTLACERPDHVLYCFVETQRWRAVDDGARGRELLPEDGEIGFEYCAHPNDVKLLAGNYCPFMGLAFPAALVRDWGLRFDERLETTEDWDFFMRARNVYPFASSDEHVALYRLWSSKGGYSSAAVAESRWRDDHDAVQAGRAASPLLFAAGFSEKVRQALGDGSSDGSCIARHMELFLDDGRGFRPQLRVVPLPVTGEADAFVFEDLKRFGPVSALRVDPFPHGPAALADYVIELHLEDGAQVAVEPHQTHTNGRIVQGQYEFPDDDPQIVCALPDPVALDRVVFRFKRAFGFIDDASASEREAGAKHKRWPLSRRR